MMCLPLPKRLLPFAVAVFAVMLAVLALAWYDGGREDLREITQPVALPETVS